MRRITAVESISLDGVMQAPGRSDEDERGGFARGAWAVPYAADPVQGRVMAGRMQGESDLLFGAFTYQVFPPSLGGGPEHPHPVPAVSGRGPQVRRDDDAHRAGDLGELGAAPGRRRGQGTARRAPAH